MSGSRARICPEPIGTPRAIGICASRSTESSSSPGPLSITSGSAAGAHLRNMAFYNFGLRLLRHVRDAEKAGKPFMTIEQAVHRLTGELADWYHLDA